MPVTLHKVIVGSRLYGLANDNSDTDCKGFFVNDFDDIYPHPSTYFGIHQHTPRPSVEFDNGLPGKDSVNGVLHNLVKFVKLSTSGNPTILEVSFVPDEFVLETSIWAREVTSFVRENCLTQLTLKHYNGYFIHEVKQAKAQQNFKSAAHAYRIATQALQISRDGILNPCMTGNDYDMVRAIRAGQYTWDNLAVVLADMDFKLQSAKKDHMPKQVDDAKVNDFLVNLHTNYYKEHGYLQ